MSPDIADIVAPAAILAMGIAGRILDRGAGRFIPRRGEAEAPEDGRSVLPDEADLVGAFRAGRIESYELDAALDHVLRGVECPWWDDIEERVWPGRANRRLNPIRSSAVSAFAVPSHLIAEGGGFRYPPSLEEVLSCHDAMVVPDGWEVVNVDQVRGGIVYRTGELAPAPTEAVVWERHVGGGEVGAPMWERLVQRTDGDVQETYRELSSDGKKWERDELPLSSVCGHDRHISTAEAKRVMKQMDGLRIGRSGFMPSSSMPAVGEKVS